MPAPTNPVTASLAAELYKNGTPMKAIMAATGLEKSTITHLAAKNGVPIRASGRPSLSHTFTQSATDLIVGLMLGDGCINYCTEPTHNSSLRVSTKTANRDWLEWIKASLYPLRSSIVATASDAAFQLYTQTSTEFTALRKHWYPMGRKIVPADVELAPLSLMAWYLGDGTRHRSGAITLYTNAFTWDDCFHLSSKMPVNVTVRAHKPGMNAWSKTPSVAVPLIYVPAEQAKELFCIIGPCPVPSFHYKFI